MRSRAQLIDCFGLSECFVADGVCESLLLLITSSLFVTPREMKTKEPVISLRRFLLPALVF